VVAQFKTAVLPYSITLLSVRVAQRKGTQMQFNADSLREYYASIRDVQDSTPEMEIHVDSIIANLEDWPVHDLQTFATDLMNCLFARDPAHGIQSLEQLRRQFVTAILEGFRQIGAMAEDGMFPDGFIPDEPETRK
jgi:hypothetical protein